jgi:hypothetical protein
MTNQWGSLSFAQFAKGGGNRGRKCTGVGIQCRQVSRNLLPKRSGPPAPSDVFFRLRNRKNCPKTPIPAASLLIMPVKLDLTL